MAEPGALAYKLHGEVRMGEGSESEAMEAKEDSVFEER
jgi:hypothetical protein